MHSPVPPRNLRPVPLAAKLGNALSGEKHGGEARLEVLK